MGTNLCSHDCIQIAFESWKSEYFSRHSIRVIDLKKKKELYFETNVNRFINPNFFYIYIFSIYTHLNGKWTLYKEIYLIIFNRIVRS